MGTSHTVKGGGGLNLNVFETGNPDGSPIFFIHGWSQAYLCWFKQLESRRLMNYRLVAIDNRGHGLSDAPRETAAYTESKLWAADIDAVINTLELAKPVLVGWSYGGLIMTDYVREYGDDQIAGINFVCAAVRLNEAALGPLIGPGFYELFDAATSNDLQTSIDGIRDFMLRCVEAKIPRDDWERALCWAMTARPDVRASLAARDVNADDVLAELKVPALVTQGRKDVTVLPAMAEHILETCASAKPSWYDASAHAPFLEETDRFNDELAAFTDSLN
ncbi:MAG: alpha/beta hydrolase [Pseudomonadota bacterium]